MGRRTVEAARAIFDGYGAAVPRARIIMSQVRGALARRLACFGVELPTVRDQLCLRLTVSGGHVRKTQTMLGNLDSQSLDYDIGFEAGPFSLETREKFPWL
jgi:hypothetical protein